MSQPIKIFGTTWCGDCHRAQAVLKGLSEPYTWIDIEKDKEAYDHVIAVVGKRKVPLIEFADGTHLVEPSNAALTDKVSALRQRGPAGSS